VVCGETFFVLEGGYAATQSHHGDGRQELADDAR
jgi:hypothetical protein